MADCGWLKTSKLEMAYTGTTARRGERPSPSLVLLNAAKSPACTVRPLELHRTWTYKVECRATSGRVPHGEAPGPVDPREAALSEEVLVDAVLDIAIRI